MRKKKEISYLDAMAQEIAFPSANHEFDRFKSELREIIDENCGYSIAKTLEYCEYEQAFYVKVEAAGQLLMGRDRDETDIVDNACVTITRGVTIDPKQPLLPQIENINAVKEAVQARFNLLAGFLWCSKQGMKMANV